MKQTGESRPEARNLRKPGALLDRFGIDALQWRALFIANLKLDFRAPFAQSGGSGGVKARIALQVSMYLMTGTLFGIFAYLVPDVFLSGSVVFSALMFFIASAVLIEFAVVVISPLDYDVLGYQPVSSATYFAARFANVLFYTTAIAATMGLPSIVAYLFTRGFNPILGVAAAIGVLLASTMTTMAVIVAYVGLAQVVRPDRLKRVLTYVQLVVSFAVYGAYLVLPAVFHLSTLATFTVRKSAWMLLYPPTWFASYLDLAVGRWSLLEILPALAGLGGLVVLTWLSAARLSLNYSELLSRQAFAGEARRTARRPLFGFRFARGEQRAIALLLSAQFRNDQRFRMMVLSIVPLTLLYLFMGVSQGGLEDPFLHAKSAGNAFLLYFAMVMFPSMLMTGIARSDAYRASWVFFVTPARRADLVMAVKNLAFVYFLLPYLLGVALVLTYFFGSALHAFLHIFVEGLVVNLFLLAVVALQPHLPFSQPVQKGTTSGWLVAVMAVGGGVQAVSNIVLGYLVYPYPAVLAALILFLLAAGLFGQWRLRRRLEQTTADLEFFG
jgi:ABC-2 type transport system permease protein